MKSAQTTAYAKRLLKLLCAVGLLNAGAVWAQVTNGGFETGTLAPWTAAVSVDSGTAAEVASSGVTPHAGAYFGMGFDNLGVGRLSQPIATVAGATYTVSAWVTSSDDLGRNAAWIRLGTASPAVSCSLTQLVWLLCTGTFTASDASEPLELQFQTVVGSGILAFDDVTVVQASAPPAAVTPVPTLNEWVLMLLAAGAAALGAGRLRRRT
ncbi:MAG: IPTL-CTERM sorting domain-containing protein [Burkholderiaceae bacterium]